MKQFLAFAASVLAGWIFAYVAVRHAMPWGLISIYWWIAMMKNVMGGR